MWRLPFVLLCFQSSIIHKSQVYRRKGRQIITPFYHFHPLYKRSKGIQTHNHLICKRTLNHFAKLGKWLSCVVSTYLYGIRLNFRYHACFEEGVSWNSGNYIMYIQSEMCTWDDNKIQGLHVPGTIKIITTMIHYCYCLMAYLKWRPIIWYRIIDKHVILFFYVKMFKATGDSFYLEIVCPDWDIY